MPSQAHGRIGIIGGGLGGLSAACVLRSRGYDVTLWERNDWFGGKACSYGSDGFRFDMGPTILTLPIVLERIFSEAGLRLSDELHLVRVDPQWRSFFPDGTTLDLFANVDAMSAELDRFSSDTQVSRGYRRFMELSRRLHGVSDRHFFWRSVGGIRDTMDMRGTFSLSVLGDLLQLRPGMTVSSVVRSHIRDPRVAQMLDHFTQYVGSAPDQSPAVLCGIAHMQTEGGVWYPMGGISAVTLALVRLAERLGVDLRLNCGVEKVLTGSSGVDGIQTDDGERVPLDAVVANSDAVRTHHELLDDPAASRFLRRRRYEPACSGVVMYLGLDRRYEHLSHHNFVFSNDPHQEFDDIYRRGEPAEDPTCYVCAPSATDPSVAPPGGEALYVLVHAPYLRPHHDWNAMWPKYRLRILAKLADVAGLRDCQSRIVCEHRLTPQDIQERYGVLQGAIYGLASHGRFFGAFKPANRSPDLAGLYLAGGSAHPGPGMPMALMSGWIAADAITTDLPLDRLRERGLRAPAKVAEA